MTTPSFSPGIFGRLDADWALLCVDESVRAAVTGWLAADRLAPAVAAAAGSWAWDLGPEQVLAALRPGRNGLGDGLSDEVLRALLRRACGAGGLAGLAARIVLQTMVPAAVRLARSQVRPFGGRSFEDVAQVVVAALYETTVSGRIHTRPGRPAANLVLDALSRACREFGADREPLGADVAAVETRSDASPSPFDHAHALTVHAAATAAGLDTEEETDRSRLELLELLVDAVESGVLSPADGRAIAWHYSDSPVSDAQAAALAGTTPGAWQRRRSRAVHALKASLRPTA
ncbi:DNA-directed RNA polymerase specialized sigma24 family protein [Kitasatospora sp. MAA19]|uniref:hypothetical protein n=1 Tax=unclassified Kitasatospora TaxID=2633591 RepID=UPI002474CEF1|nr:hypothetical protein [Kitasatospora sp. MAA19]MDH6710930.1 DNA-directed RNA polymerase specialized sigma24 family protein [Kitasatospora sp. MAA19]